MGLESSKQVVLRFFEAHVTEDLHALDALLTDDCRVFVSGDFAASGWKNKAEHMSIQRGVHGTEPMFTSLSYELGYITAEDDRVSVEAEIHASLTAGGEYNNQFHFLFRTRGDQIVEIKEYMDTLYVSRSLRGIESIDGQQVSGLTYVSQRVPAK